MNISLADELDLGWFFGIGQTAFERSTVGPMLERAEMFGNSHIGYVYSASEGKEVLRYERIPRASLVWGRVQDGEIVYSGCEVTARPTAETREAGGYVPELRDLEKHAKVNGVLRVVARRNPLAWYALEAYYGDLAADWQRSLPKPGKIGALYHLTIAGQRLLEDSAADALKRGQPVECSAARRLQNEVGAPKKSARTKARLMNCEKQALLLRIEAFAAWCEARAELKRGRGRQEREGRAA